MVDEASEGTTSISTMLSYITIISFYYSLRPCRILRAKVIGISLSSDKIFSLSFLIIFFDVLIIEDVALFYVACSQQVRQYRRHSRVFVLISPLSGL